MAVVNQDKKRVMQVDQAVDQAALVIAVKQVAQVMPVAIVPLKVLRVGQMLMSQPPLLQAAVVRLR